MRWSHALTKQSFKEDKFTLRNEGGKHELNNVNVIMCIKGDRMPTHLFIIKMTLIH